MTIIAYAGDDPTFGLPGISSNIDRTIEWRFAQVVTYFIPTWLTRGWTFQENFLSKRRLFFTKLGLVYICERSTISEVNCDLPESKFESLFRQFVDKHITRRVPTDLKTALFDAEQIMAWYSDMKLGHESDSLNAIVGVLNTLSARQFPIRHIWGVPFTTEKTANGSIVWISLNWLTSNRGARRSAFPSWSSLGWSSGDGGVIDTPYFCSKDFHLEIWQNNKFQSIREIEEGYQDAHFKDPESQRLQITAYSVPSDVSLWINPSKEGQYYHQNILPGTDNLESRFNFYWDSEQHAPERDAPVLYVFESALPRFGLILKCHGKYYERVGCFTMDQKLDLSQFRHCTEELCDKSLSRGFEVAVASRLIQRRTIELR